jgi:hypothetical protein
MKLAKRIGIWIIISLVLQSILLFYLNNYYFAEEKNIKYKSVSNAKSSSAVEKKISYKIPENAQDIQSSYDGKYVSYYTYSTLNVVNIDTGSKNEISLEAKSIKSFSRWLDDRDILIIAEKQIVSSKNILKFYSYDVKQSLKKETKDYMNNRDVYISLPSVNANITDIGFNTNNTITYPVITVNNKTSSVYRVDVSLPIEKLSLKTSYIGKIKISNLYDKVVYEDSVNKKIYFGTDSKPLSIKDITQYSLLAVDKDSNVYVGELVDNKITNIYYGGLKDSTENWQKYSLTESVAAKDVFVSNNGKVYVNNGIKAAVTELSSQKETKYEGVLENINEKSIFSLKNSTELIRTGLTQ